MKYIRVITSVILCLLLIISIPIRTDAAATSLTINGIDVSQFQGNINFSAVKNSGIDIVYIRAGEGSNFTDPNFETNYQNALAAGLNIGFYHFVTARTTQEAVTQAQFFYSLINGKNFVCYPAMDFESFGSLTNEEINAIASTYLSTLAGLLGYNPALYSDAFNAANLWDASLSVYPLWVADYSVQNPATGPWSEWAGFQYTDTGSVSGISGNVDRDYFRNSIYISQSSADQQSTSQINSNNSSTPSGSVPAPDISYSIYKVRRGDTLWGLSLRFRTTVSILAQINHIPNPNLIFTGQILYIPEYIGNSAVTSVVIQRGDTLWGFSQEYGVSVNTLADFNHIRNPNLIYAGNLLLIP